MELTSNGTRSSLDGPKVFVLFLGILAKVYHQFLQILTLFQAKTCHFAVIFKLGLSKPILVFPPAGLCGTLPFYVKCKRER